MKNSIWRTAAGLLPLLPFLAVLQSGTDTPPSHGVPARSLPLRELTLISREGWSPRSLAVTLATSGLRMQAILVPASVGGPVAPQDRVFSLDPQRDGDGPLTLLTLLTPTGAHHA